MNPLDISPTNMVAAAETAFRQAGALAVEYSFSVVGALILLTAGFILAGAFQRWSYLALGRLHGFDETLRRFFSNIIRYAILIVVGVTVLAQFGVQTASIIATLGAVGLAIGLALQGTLQNIAAGIMLLVLRPFRAEEYIESGEVKGIVKEIGLFATELQTLDGLYVLAPNSELWKAPVTNFTRNPRRRQDLTIGIGYGDDIELARKVLAGLASAEDRVLANPAPETFVTQLSASTVDVTLRYWTSTPDWLRTKFELTRAAKLAFDENGISMPFPQQDVHYLPQPRDAANGTVPPARN